MMAGPTMLDVGQMLQVVGFRRADSGGFRSIRWPIGANGSVAGTLDAAEPSTTHRTGCETWSGEQLWIGHTCDQSGAKRTELRGEDQLLNCSVIVPYAERKALFN